MDEDHAALFGATADDAIPVDGDGEHVEEPPAPNGNTAKRPRPSTSPVWADYEKLFKEINGKTVSIGGTYLYFTLLHSSWTPELK